MSFTIKKLDIRISSSGMKTGVLVSNDTKSCKLTITALAASKNNWRLNYIDFDGDEYALSVEDYLPVLKWGDTLDLENPMQMAELAHHVKTNGTKMVNG